MVFELCCRVESRLCQVVQGGGVLEPGQVLEGRRQGWEEGSICTGWEPRLLSRVLEAEQAGGQQARLLHGEKRQVRRGRRRPATLHPAQQSLTNSFFLLCNFQQSQASLLLDRLLDGTDRHECNCCQLAGNRSAAESNVSAELLLPAPPAQTSSVASAPIHAPYWRRRGLSVQIISPLPPEPLSAPGQTTFLELQHQLPLLSVPLRYVRDKRPQGRKQAAEVPTTTCKAFKV